MLSTKVLFLIFIKVILQLCTSEKIIYPLNGLRVAQINKSYSLVCDWGPGLNIEWMDSNGDYIDIRFNCRMSGKKTTKIFSDSTTACNFRSKTSILYIPKISKAHDGQKIKCITDNKEEEFQLQVSGQTELTHFLIMTFSKKEIYTGEEVEIKCSWNSEHQEMNVKLKCGNETKTENGSALLKLTMTKEWNKKLCKCEGMHLRKHIVTSQLIHVYYAPEVYVNNLTVAAGTMAMLNCSVDKGYPETYSHLEWHHFFNKILLETRPPSNEDGSLVIPNTTWQDAGTWICLVTNGKYNQSSYGYLTVTGPPILQALNTNVKAISGENKKLEVQIFPFYDNIDITWKHNGQKITKGTPIKSFSDWQQKIKGQEVYLSGLIVSLLLNDIKQKDAGNYSVYVVTKDGTSLCSFDMQISTKSGMTLTIAFIICGTLILVFFVSLFGCFLCHSQRKKYHHSTMIDSSMSTPRTRIFSIPKNDPMNVPNSNFELDIYEEIDDWNGNVAFYNNYSDYRANN